MFNFTDTETSDSKYQRICQLAAVLCDEKGNEIEVLNELIYPDGWEVCDYFANEVHGITTQMCYEKGKPMPEVLERFGRILASSKKVICHNYNFDQARILNELTIYKKVGYADLFKQTPWFCTMLHTTDICKLPKARGTGYKWPKLQEAHKHFFGAEFDGAHDALADLRATKRIYFEINKPLVVNPTIENAKVEVKEDDFSQNASL